MASSRDDGAAETPVKWRPSFTFVARWSLKTAMWLIFLEWLAMTFMYPAPSLLGKFLKWFNATDKSFYGLLGSFLWMFGAHVFVMAILAAIYLMAFPAEYKKKTKSKFLRFRLSTFPALVSGPFGVVSAAELIGILIVVAYIIWACYAYTLQNYRSTSKLQLSSSARRHLMMENTGYRLGTIGMFVVTLLFLPISRGSVLLRIIDVPFEQATRYHIWLGHLTMTIFTLHSLCYMVSWGLKGELPHKLLKWNKLDVSYFPGLVSLVSGLLMWLTTLNPVRRQNFELFFYTHQLYAVFIIFFALHVGDFLFSVSSGAIFLFMLDRFLRFCQSRANVGLVSATNLPCGAIELVISKPKDLQYSALSFIFLKVKEISQLEWHPFSVSSSTLDGENHLSVVIKGLGRWTKTLCDSVSNAPTQVQRGMPFRSDSRLTLSVEGPYGHQSPYHLRYEHLIVVAGGIGITPFLAIMSDILHRIKDKKPCPPKQILLIWAMKRSQELSLLSLVDAESICSSFSDDLHIQIQTYVTQESEPQLEDGNAQKSIQCPMFHDVNRKSISSLVATGDNMWYGAYVIISTVGFFVLLTLLKAFYIKPHKITTWWLLGLIFIMCMAVSIVVFGGVVIFLWNRCERRTIGSEKCIDGNESSGRQQLELNSQSRTSNMSLLRLNTTHYGMRPNLQAIFSSFSNRWGNVDVGVVVCGPPNLNSSVAAECRSQNIWRRWNQSVFHFHSHSFEL